MKKSRKYIIRFILFFFIGIAPVMLKAENILSTKSVEGIQGHGFVLEVQIQNSSQIVGFQFDLEIPSGVKLYEDNASLSSRKNDHNLIISSIATNKYRCISYSTSQTSYSGSSGTIVSIPCTIPESMSTGTYPVGLSNCVLGNVNSVNVIDNYQNGSLIVSSSNNQPVANAGPDQTVNELTLVTLDGSQSYDPDGYAIAYSWTAPNGITLINSSISNPTFTAPEITEDKTFTFSLIVNDGILNSVADEVVITIKQVNKTPIADAGEDQNVNVGDLVTLDASSSFDDDGDNLTYLWSAPTEIKLNSNTNLQPAFIVPSVSVPTKFAIVLTVNDGIINSIPDTIYINVVIENQPPVANAGNDQSVVEGDLVTLDGSQSYDPDGDNITYLWISLNEIELNDIEASKPSFIAPDVSAETKFVFTLIVNDGLLESRTDSVIILVSNSTGVNTLSNDETNLFIYPNPTSGLLSVKNCVSLIGEDLFVYNITGELIKKVSITLPYQKIDISDIQDGAYSLVIGQKQMKILKFSNNE